MSPSTIDRRPHHDDALGNAAIGFAMAAFVVAAWLVAAFALIELL